jgi:glycosyl transferase, family 25
MLPLQILVISLKHSAARQAKVTSEMAKTRLEWSFMDAVDGSKLDLTTVPYNAAKVKRMQGYTLTSREIGCYLSHMKCWQACVDKSVPTLIFEDDFILEPHFEEVLSTLVNCHRNWQIVRLQALEHKADAQVADFGRYRLVRNEGDPLGATAYLVNPESARRLIEESREIYEPLDHFIEHHEKHGLQMLAIKPYPVTVVDVTRATSTITDRPDRAPVRGWRKLQRSLFRLTDRLVSRYPWFPK